MLKLIRCKQITLPLQMPRFCHIIHSNMHILSHLEDFCFCLAGTLWRLFNPMQYRLPNPSRELRLISIVIEETLNWLLCFKESTISFLQQLISLIISLFRAAIDKIYLTSITGSAKITDRISIQR